MTIQFTAHLSVYKGHSRYVSSQFTLYTKGITSSFVPMGGDKIELWEDGPMAPVRERYVDHKGFACADLTGVVIDPDGNEKEWHRGQGSLRHWFWFSEADGDLEERLVSGGWKAAR
jgi:hypothetical protein